MAIIIVLLNSINDKENVQDIISSAKNRIQNCMYSMMHFIKMYPYMYVYVFMQRKKTGRKKNKISAVVAFQVVFILFFRLFFVFQIFILCMPCNYQRKITDVTKENVNRGYV